MRVEDMKPDLEAQTEEQKERVKLVDERSKEGEHVEEDMSSYIQLAYYAGQQYIAVVRSTKTIVPLPPKEDWQIQYVANRIMPTTRTELAKIMRNKLTKMVVPASSSDDDVRSARLADKVVEWMEYALKLQEVDEEVIMWALTTRIGFIKVFWNPAKGQKVGALEGEELFEGDIDIDILNLFEVKWDPSASRWDEKRWCVHEKQRSVQYVEEVYGVKVAPEDGLGVANVYDIKLRNLSSGANVIGGAVNKAKDQVVVKEYWEMPCAKYPKGRRITTASGRELLYEDDIGFGPEDTTPREIPIFSLIHIPIPGKIVGSSVVEQLMPVQKEYNRSRSQIIENKNLMANPVWVVEAQSVEGEIETGPGGIIQYKHGFNAPFMSQPASLGADVDKNIERCLEEMMFISGQQEVSHGSTPAGVNSGVAIQLLQEQDDTKLGPTVAKYGRFKQKYMSYGLKLIRHKYTLPRLVSMVGKNKRMEVLEFKGSDLTSTDVRFEDQSLTALSAAARKQYIIELVTLGVLNPQMDKDLIMRMLELGVTDELYDALEIDVQQALNENAAWAKKDFTPITREFYAHEVHVAQHNKFRKGTEYTDLSPEEQQLVDMHVQEHMDFIYKATMQQAQAAQTANPEDTGGIDPNKVQNALDPEEQEAVQADPSLLDSAR